MVFIAAVLAGIELIFSCNATGGAAFYLCMHDAELLVRRAVETSISCVNGRRRTRHVVIVGFEPNNPGMNLFGNLNGIYAGV